MSRALDVNDIVGLCASEAAAYRVVELGPCSAAVLIGRCVRAFTLAAPGYL